MYKAKNHSDHYRCDQNDSDGSDEDRSLEYHYDIEDQSLPGVEPEECSSRLGGTNWYPAVLQCSISGASEVMMTNTKNI